MHEDMYESTSACMLKVQFDDFEDIKGKRHINVSIYDNEGYGQYQMPFEHTPSARALYNKTVQVLLEFRQKLVDIGWDISPPYNENFEDITSTKEL